VSGVAADFLSVEHVDLSQAGDGFLAEAPQGYVDQLATVLPCDSPPGGPGWGMAEHGDVSFVAVMAGRGEQSFLERVGPIEPWVDPDIGNRPWREQEHRPTVAGHSDTGPGEFGIRHDVRPSM